MTADGQSIKRFALVRSAAPHTLTPLGWDQLADAGIRTLVDLRHDWEVSSAPITHSALPASVSHVVVALEPPGYIEAWSGRDDRWKLATPLYYEEFLATYGHRVTAVVETIIEAPPGGVLLHCGSGRDRAGLAVAILLDLLGVDHQAIIDDHWLSYDRPEPVEVAMGKESSLAAHPIDRELHHGTLSGVLRAQPAVGCYGDKASAQDAGKRLADRLVATP